tara:strand:+ start:1298 stop:1543 length:246 start_codon:yes stop_codon:yes gene_type:complete
LALSLSPSIRQAARALTKDPISDVYDQSGGLRERDEFGSGNFSMPLMSSSEQGFDTDNLTNSNINFWLRVEPQPIVKDHYS